MTTTARINVELDASQAMAQLRALQAQMQAFGARQVASSATMAAAQKAHTQSFLDQVNATRMWTAEMVNANSHVDRFSKNLERGKLSMGEYFRYGATQSRLFRRVFQTEFDTIDRLAKQRVRSLQTQYVAMERAANGAVRAAAIRPTDQAMNWGAAGAQAAVAAQRQQIWNKVMRDGSTAMVNWGKNTQWAGRQLMVGFSIPLGIAGAMAAKTFMDLEKAGIQFKRVYGDLSTPTGEAEKNLKAIQALGAEYAKYGISVAQTVDISARAAATGLQNQDLLAGTEQTLRLATLGQMDYQQALEATITLQTAFGISSNDLGKTIDYLNAAENQTILSLDDITKAIPRVAPVIKGLGGNVQDLAVMMTALREGGVTAEQGANALKSGLGSLINPTDTATTMLKGLGINIKKMVKDNEGDLMGMVTDFGEALSKLSNLERQQALEKVFGKYQYARMGALFKNLARDGSQAQRAMELAGMSTQELATLSERELSKISDSVTFKFTAAIERFKLAIAPIGEIFLKAVTPIIDFGTRLFEAFNAWPDALKTAVTVAVTAIAGIAPIVLMTIGLIGNGLGNLMKTINMVRGAFARLRGRPSGFQTGAELEEAAMMASLEGKINSATQAVLVQENAVLSLKSAYESMAGAASAAMARTTSASASAAQVVNPMVNATTGPKFTPGDVEPQARARGDLVAAHITMSRALTPQQIAEYERLAASGTLGSDAATILNKAKAQGSELTGLSNATVMLSKKTNWDLFQSKQAVSGLVQDIQQGGMGFGVPLARIMAQHAGGARNSKQVLELFKTPAYKSFLEELPRRVITDLASQFRAGDIIGDAQFGPVVQRAARDLVSRQFGVDSDEMRQLDRAINEVHMLQAGDHGRGSINPKLTGQTSYRNSSIDDTVLKALQDDPDFKKAKVFVVDSEGETTQAARPTPVATRQSAPRGSDISGRNVDPLSRAPQTEALAAPPKRSIMSRVRGMSPGRAMFGAGMALDAVSMAMMFSGNEQLAGIGQAVMPIGMLANVIGMIPAAAIPAASAIGAVVGAIGLSAYAYYQSQRGIEEAAAEAERFGNAVTMAGNTFNAIAEEQKKKTAIEKMQAGLERRRSSIISRLSGTRQGNVNVGEGFFAGAAGQQMLQEIGQTNAAFGAQAAGEILGERLAQMRLSKVITGKQQRGILEFIGRQNANLALSATATIEQIIGPNGEDLRKDPISVAVDLTSRAGRRAGIQQGGRPGESTIPMPVQDVYDTGIMGIFNQDAEIRAGQITAQTKLAQDYLASVVENRAVVDQIYQEKIKEAKTEKERGRLEQERLSFQEAFAKDEVAIVSAMSKTMREQFKGKYDVGAWETMWDAAGAGVVGRYGAAGEQINAFTDRIKIQLNEAWDQVSSDLSLTTEQQAGEFGKLQQRFGGLYTFRLAVQSGTIPEGILNWLQAIDPAEANNIITTTFGLKVQELGGITGATSLVQLMSESTPEVRKTMVMAIQANATGMGIVAKNIDKLIGMPENQKKVIDLAVQGADGPAIKDYLELSKWMQRNAVGSKYRNALNIAFDRETPRKLKEIRTEMLALQKIEQRGGLKGIGSIGTRALQTAASAGRSVKTGLQGLKDAQDVISDMRGAGKKKLVMDIAMGRNSGAVERFLEKWRATKANERKNLKYNVEITGSGSSLLKGPRAASEVMSQLGAAGKVMNLEASVNYVQEGEAIPGTPNGPEVLPDLRASVYYDQINGSSTPGHPNYTGGDGSYTVNVTYRGRKPENDGGWIGLNSGNWVPGGSDGPNRDSVPALLTPGEFVVTRDQAQKHASLLEDINAGRNGYAEGGMVKKFIKGIGPGGPIVGRYEALSMTKKMIKSEFSEQLMSLIMAAENPAKLMKKLLDKSSDKLKKAIKDMEKRLKAEQFISGISQIVDYIAQEGLRVKAAARAVTLGVNDTAAEAIGPEGVMAISRQLGPRPKNKKKLKAWKKKRAQLVGQVNDAANQGIRDEFAAGDSEVNAYGALKPLGNDFLKKVAESGVSFEEVQRWRDAGVSLEDINTELQKRIDAQKEINDLGKTDEEILQETADAAEELVSALDAVWSAQQRINEATANLEMIRVYGKDMRQVALEREQHENDIAQIQREQIDTRQTQIDLLSHENEVLQRGVDKVNEAYDQQFAALDAIAAKEQQISGLKQGQLSLADALSKGDIAGAARARNDYMSQYAQYATESTRKALEAQRDAATYQARERIRLNDEAIWNLNQQIYDVQQSQIKPLQDQLVELDKVEQAYNDIRIKADLSSLTTPTDDENPLVKYWNAVSAAANAALAAGQAAVAANGGVVNNTPAADGGGGPAPTPAPSPAPAPTPGGSQVTVETLMAKFERLNAESQKRIRDEARRRGHDGAKAWFTNMSPSRKAGMLMLMDNNNVTPTELARMASGGIVPGLGNKDTFPALLTPGEFVVNKAASTQFRSLLEKINASGGPRFNIPANSGAGISAGVYNNNASYTINVAVNGTNASPDDIANAIMNRIQQTENMKIRSYRY